MNETKEASPFHYVAAALFSPLNIAALIVGIIVAGVAIGFHAPAWLVISILTALEVAYLGFYGPSEAWKKKLDEKEAGKSAQLPASERQKKRYEELYNGLEPGLRRQFDEIRGRCNAFNSMSEQYSSSMVGMEQLSGVNKLLWVYLKLLHTKMSLDSFFRTLNPDELDRTERDALRRLEDIPKDDLDPMTEKMRQSIEDTIQTVRARRENIKRARDNVEFVNLEIDRIGVKLTGISEMAINRHDPSAITQDVDGVARSVEATEQAIGELNLFTGFTAVDDVAPDILTRQKEKARVR